MNEHTKRSLDERKRIVTILLENFKKDYDFYFEPSYKMPEPKLPDKLKNVDLSSKQMARIPIDPLRKSVLCGTCLADSSLQIQKNYKNARIQNRHSTRQAAWFFWKWQICLKQYVSSNDSFQFQDLDGHQLDSKLFSKAEKQRLQDGEILGKLKIASVAHADLTALHDVICTNKGGKMMKTISRHWLNHMTDYFLMTVWCDDGSLYNKRQGYICLDSIPKNQQTVFVDYLKTVWEIDSYIFPTGQNLKTGEPRFRIAIKDQESLLRLLRVVAPIIPVKEMLYKVMFVPINNSGLLQRWASEVINIVKPEFRSYMSDEYKQIISNYNQPN